MNYIVIDVETPNIRNDSICALGVDIIDDTNITNEWYTLVDPEASFDQLNIGIHNIQPEMVVNAPKFEDIWQKLLPYCSTHTFIAHNALFDLTVLAKALANRGQQMPEIKYLCTVDLGRKLYYKNHNVKGDLVLSNFAKTLDVELVTHHNALCDVRACSGIFLKLRQLFNFNPIDYIKNFSYNKNRKLYK